MRYNWLKLLKEGFNNNSGWEKTWKNPELKKEFNERICSGKKESFTCHHSAEGSWESTTT